MAEAKAWKCWKCGEYTYEAGEINGHPYKKCLACGATDVPLKRKRK